MASVEIGTRIRVQHKALWCVLFALVASGPYLLGLDGGTGTPSSSRTYAFVALGIIAGIWATQYPSMAALLRRPEVWRPCTYGGLAVDTFLVAFNLLALLVPVLSNPLYRDGMGGWMACLHGLADAVGSGEAWLAFAVALACGAASARFANSPRDETAHCPVFAGAFLAGLLQSTAYGALLTSPLGVLLLWGILFEWSHILARYGDVRSEIVALCLGELACRVAARLGLPFPLAGYGPEGLVLIVWVACLAISAAVSLRPRKRTMPDAQDEKTAADGSAKAGEPMKADDPRANSRWASALETWERERLVGAGLTARELDVLEASIDGCDSKEAARRLGVSPSTVRTYKGRICKKLDLASFDRVLGFRSAQMGSFEPVDSAEAEHAPQQAERVAANPAEKRRATSAFLRLTGCLSLLLLLLMPFGVLPLYWNSSWTMAYACATGILLSFAPVFLRPTGRRRMGATGNGAPSIAFLICAAACFAVRLHIWLGATGLGLFQRLAIFATVTGLVCFGLVAFRSCAGSMHLVSGRFGASCACAAGTVVVASFGMAFWAGAATLSLLVFAAGLALGNMQGDKHTGHNPDAHPAVAASWFVVAFVWEESWRGVVYASLQSIAVPFLIVVASLDTLVLLKRRGTTAAACVATLACTALLCLEQNLVFGMLAGTLLLEAQVLHAGAHAPYTRAGSREDLPPALLAAAAGCCAAVSIANAWGSHVLLHTDSALPTGLGWLVPCCFAATLAVALWRVAHARLASVMGELGVDRARLEGYLTGKGLTDLEVKVCVALAHGASAAQIAEELSYSVSAMGAARRSAFSKLGVATKYQYMASLWSEFGPRQGKKD